MRGLRMLVTKDLNSQKDTNKKYDSPTSPNTPNTPLTPITPSTPVTNSPRKMFRFFFGSSPKIEKYSVENIR